MKLLTMLIMTTLMVFTVFAEDTTKMTEEQYLKRLQETKEAFEKTLPKFAGNLEAYYMIFDYMGKGYVKLETDIIVQIKDFASTKSSEWTMTFNAKDDANFSVKQTWKIKRSDFYTNDEGFGIYIKRFSLEKGVYRNISLSLNGDNNETLSASIPEFRTLQLSDLKAKVGQMFLINSMNEVRDNMFMRRKATIIPNLSAYYNKIKTFGFFFEYYHLKSDALTSEGSYQVKYKIINEIFNTPIHEATEVLKDQHKNGAIKVPPIDLSSVHFGGVYRLEVEFTDLSSGEKFEKKMYFYIEKPLNKENENK